MTTFGEGDQIKGLSVVNSGLDLGEIDLHGGDGFTEEIDSFTTAGKLDEAVDAAMSGKAAPRVWAVLDEEQQTESRVVAALTVARVLAERGQKVIVLDVDEQRPYLTRWAGLHEQDGWIDFARYGASILSCGLDLPWPGARLLGVGSFCPTQIEGADIEDLIGRLRRQADDVILCLPLTGADSAWIGAAGIRLLCWDRMVRDEKQMAGIIAGLDHAIETPAVIVAFGPDAAGMDAEIESALLALSESSADAGEMETVAADGMLTQDFQESEEAAVELPVGGAGEEPDGGGSAELIEPGARPVEPDDENFAASTARGTSPLFWRLVAVAAILAVLIGYAWYTGFFTGMPDQAGELASQGVEADISSPQDASPAAEQGGPDSEYATDVAEDPGESNGAPAEVVKPAVTDVSTGTPTGTPTEIPAEASDEVEIESPLDEGSNRYYDRSVGSDGWALHVYSFADSSAAAAEAKSLGADGIQAIWMAVELPGQGRWYRVYVGSFSSSDEARAAEEELLPRLGVDWAMPVRF